MNAHHVRATGCTDLVGLVPTLLGFVPVRTAVLLGLARTDEGEGGARLSRVVVTALYEYDRLGADDVDLWRVALRGLVAQGATATVVVHYEDAPRQALEAHAALGAALSETSLEVVEVVRVIDGRLYTLTDAVASGAVLSGGLGPGVPVPGRADLPELAPLVAQGLGAPASSLADLVESYRAGSGDSHRVNLVEVACRAALQREADVAEAFAGLAMVLGARCGDATVEEMPDVVLAAAITGLADVRVRDAVLAWLVPGSMPPGTDWGPFLDVMPRMSGRDTFTPDLEERGAMLERLRVFLTLCPRQRSAPVAAMVGIYFWRFGDGVMARRVWEAGQDVDPDYRLLSLLLQALAVGMRCPSS